MPLVYFGDDVYYIGSIYNLNLICMYATYYPCIYLGLEWEYIEEDLIPGLSYYIPVNPSPDLLLEFFRLFGFAFDMLTYLVEYYTGYNL